MFIQRLTSYQVQARLKEKEEQHSSTQTELDDLLMVFGDLEDKVEKYKVWFILHKLRSAQRLMRCPQERLKDLGETISDGEEEEDGDNDDDDDDDTEDGEVE